MNIVYPLEFKLMTPLHFHAFCSEFSTKMNKSNPYFLKIFEKVLDIKVQNSTIHHEIYSIFCNYLQELISYNVF